MATRIRAPLVVLALVAPTGAVGADEQAVAELVSSAPWAAVSVIAGTIVVVLQTALIVGLLVHRAHRRRVQLALAERLRFETLLSGLSATFVSLPVGDVGAAIENGLQRIVNDLDIDRAVLAELGSRRELARVTYGWTRTGIAPPPMAVNLNEFPWMGARLGRGEIVQFSSVGELPEEAATDRHNVTALGVRSLVAVPLVVGGVIVGTLACSSLRAEHAWPDELVQRLRLVAEVFANALARRRAESRIRESEVRFRLMADGAPWMVWMSDPDARRTYFNGGWLDVTGRRLEDEVGEGWTAGVHPEDRQACLATVRQAIVTRRPFTLDYRLQRWDGEYRWILDHGVPRLGTDGAVVGYIGSATDVTELKTAQQVLVESHALRSAVFGSLHGHVAALDRRGVILAVNESWLRFAAENGATPALVSVGAHYLEVCQRAAAMGDADARHAVAAITAVLEGASEHGQLEYLCHTANGARWFEMSVQPLRRTEGGAVVTHVDVTRRRHAEDLASRQREELERTLRATTLGQLATSLAHEVNQPLAAIVANAQATLHVLDASLRPNLREAGDVRETLEDIAADAKRASEIIHRLRGVLRKEHTTSSVLGVNELVENVVSLLWPDLGRKGITVVRDYDPHVPPVSGDPVQLQEVLLSLLVNASEAIGAAGDGPRDITVGTAVREAGLVEISIGDTGIGVEESAMARIFEHFVSTKQDALGTGLSTSRWIIQAHGGRIWATRRGGRGLTVHVALPVAHRTFVR